MREKKCPNNPHPPLLKAQQALALLLSQLVGGPGTGSLPSTIAPSDHPHFILKVDDSKSHRAGMIKRRESGKTGLRITTLDDHTADRET